MIQVLRITSFSVLLLLLGSGMLFTQSEDWIIYDGTVDLDGAEPPWELNQVQYFPTIEDVEDAMGGKVLQFHEPTNFFKSEWQMPLALGADSAGTVVFRARFLDEFGRDTTNQRVFDVRIFNGRYEEDFRLFAHNDTTHLNRSLQTTGFLEGVDTADVLRHFDVVDGEWNVWRIAWRRHEDLPAMWLYVYLNEDPEWFMRGISGRTRDRMAFRIGDPSDSDRVDGQFDWVVWNESGAYAPGEGPPLPDNLTGLPTVSVHNSENGVPDTHILYQNYPNPFNPLTNIEFGITEAGMVKLTVYDVLGREVETVLSDNIAPGNYSVKFDATGLPSGTYFYILEINNQKMMKRMVYLK